MVRAFQKGFPKAQENLFYPFINRKMTASSLVTTHRRLASRARESLVLSNLIKMKSRDSVVKCQIEILSKVSNLGYP